ncbi:MAG: hypothetical protein ABI277_14295 [Burkholderiaceae bacterium]
MWPRATTRRAHRVDPSHRVDFDKESQIVELASGMFGDVFEKTIQDRSGMTMGHWPSSFGIMAFGWTWCSRTAA